MQLPGQSQHSPLTKITSIDPYPRAEIDRLSQVIVRKPFESLKADQTLADLEAGDMLFIDNSHRVLPNSDATVFFLEWLPKLADGVIVQIHDIYLPWDYPPKHVRPGILRTIHVGDGSPEQPKEIQTLLSRILGERTNRHEHCPRADLEPPKHPWGRAPRRFVLATNQRLITAG